MASKWVPFWGQESRPKNVKADCRLSLFLAWVLVLKMALVLGPPDWPRLPECSHCLNCLFFRFRANFVEHGKSSGALCTLLNKWPSGCCKQMCEIMSFMINTMSTLIYFLKRGMKSFVNSRTRTMWCSQTISANGFVRGGDPHRGLRWIPATDNDVWGFEWAYVRKRSYYLTMCAGGLRSLGYQRQCLLCNEFDCYVQC